MISKPALVVSSLAFLLSSPFVGAANDPEKLTPEQVLAHPEVQGTLAVIEAWIEGVQLFGRVPGISAGIVLDQELLWHQGYGYSNLETERPADADTIYSICSISKLFTSIGIMQLRDGGSLQLNDPVVLASRLVRHSADLRR